MKILAIVTLTLGLFLSVLTVQGVELKDGHPEIYFVKKGDTLWDISAMFLNKPWLWPEIWHVNPQVDNPHLIYPGDELRLVYVDGKPRIVRNNDLKLSPEVRVLSEGDAIPTIPLDIIRPFLSTPRILNDDEIDSAPYILAADSQRLIFGQGNKVYFRGEKDENLSAYSLFRKGDAYYDPETNELLGIEAIHLGSGKKIRSGDPATMMINESVQEIMAGDRALPYEEQVFPPVFMLRSPDTDINAYIISVYNGVTQIGTYDVVILNNGTREGLDVGHVLTVMQSGRVVEDSYSDSNPGAMVTLPSEVAGELLVFRTFEKTSLGLIMRANRPMHVMDTAVTPN
ncbi:MAG: LysM peptidoglycan-binding domain-containing protein [Gammaproteobacteria bacterium]|nr:LysM peptidoglycan-binding domain-containing protein [Gammaproteobacteria bacterium]NNJ72648.1 LysM peptidoglycan-binding domain-containing protein [Enterobacterales bacterium]